MARIPLKRIAEVARLSPATVSRVLRGKDGVSQHAQQAVGKALQQLGVESYAPESGAQLIRIAVVTGEPVGTDVDPYEELFLNVTSRLFRQGFMPIRLVAGPGDKHLAVEIIDAGTTAALVLGGGHAGPIAKELLAAHLPTIRVSQTDHRDIPQIMLDSAAGIDTAVRHLINVGHRRIGLSVPRNSATAARVARFRSTLADVLYISATRDQAPVAIAEPGMPAGIAAANSLLDQGCTAIVTSAPSLTFGVLEATARKRLRVPDHVSVLTVGALPGAEVLNPPATQVTFDWSAVAAVAVGALESLLRSPASCPNYAVTPELILRSSDKPISRR